MWTGVVAHLNEPEPPEPERGGAVNRYLLAIVEVALAGPCGVTTRTRLRCRRRPGRRACEGALLVRRHEVPAEVQWGCPLCRDHGRIRGFVPKAKPKAAALMGG
ncbi:MAG: hypothetical protein EXR76_11735 [Myxococcales bacterium]|nr:hypothetical protein [Myxococcales bacterium]